MQVKMKYVIYLIQEHDSGSKYELPRPCNLLWSSSIIDINAAHQQCNRLMEDAKLLCSLKDKCPNIYEIRETI